MSHSFPGESHGLQVNLADLPLCIMGCSTRKFKVTQILNHQQAIESSRAVQAVKNISQIHQVDYGVSWHMAPENFQQTVWL